MAGEEQRAEGGHLEHLVPSPRDSGRFLRRPPCYVWPLLSSSQDTNGALTWGGGPTAHLYSLSAFPAFSRFFWGEGGLFACLFATNTPPTQSGNTDVILHAVADAGWHAGTRRPAARPWGWGPARPLGQNAMTPSRTRLIPAAPRGGLCPTEKPAPGTRTPVWPRLRALPTVKGPLW